MSQRAKVSVMPMAVKRIQREVVHQVDERELDHLLDRWRDWSSDGFNTGYKTRTIEHQLMIEGAVTRSTGSNVKEDPDCEKLDAAISMMPSNMKRAIKLKYLFGFTNKDAAQTLKLPLPTFKSLIQRCRAWLCGKLTENK